MKTLDTTKILKRMIIVSWVALGCCFLIKLLGGNIFEIVVNNQRFIAICNFADNNWWTRYFIGITNTFLCTYLFCLAIMGQIKYKKWQLIVLIPTVLIGTAIKLEFTNLGWIFDCWQMIILPIIFLNKRYKEYYKIIIANALLLVFQVISLLTKNLGLEFVVLNGMLITFIFCIDVTIMLVLYFLYANLIKIKKGVKNNELDVCLVSKRRCSRTQKG